MNHCLTVPQVAEMLTLSKQQIYRLVRLKKIPHVRIENRLFFDPEALGRWIAEHSVAAS